MLKVCNFFQGFLRNERENAILAAIEEARKNVSSNKEIENLYMFLSSYIV